MKRTRRKFNASFKAKVAIDAIKEQSSLQELAAKYKIHPNQISSWKREFMDNADLAFKSRSEKEDPTSDNGPLYNKIGQLGLSLTFGNGT